MSRKNVEAIGWGCGALASFTAVMWTVGSVGGYGPGFVSAVGNGVGLTLVGLICLAIVAAVGFIVFIVGDEIRRFIARGNHR